MSVYIGPGCKSELIGDKVWLACLLEDIKVGKIIVGHIRMRIPVVSVVI